MLHVRLSVIDSISCVEEHTQQHILLRDIVLFQCRLLLVSFDKLLLEDRS